MAGDLRRAISGPGIRRALLGDGVERLLVVGARGTSSISSAVDRSKLSSSARFTCWFTAIFVARTASGAPAARRRAHAIAPLAHVGLRHDLVDEPEPLGLAAR